MRDARYDGGPFGLGRKEAVSTLVIPPTTPEEEAALDAHLARVREVGRTMIRYHADFKLRLDAISTGAH